MAASGRPTEHDTCEAHMTPRPSGAEEIATVDWGVAARALGGGPISGDQFAVVGQAGRVLLAVIDGLGHGHGAQVAALTAVSTLQRHADDDLATLIRRCHERLRPTRGAVMCLAALNLAAAELTWIGVGNVEASLFRLDGHGPDRRQVLFQRGGVVGYSLPSIHLTTTSIDDGDVLVLATDGVRSDFHRSIRAASDSQQIADQILASHGRSTDDALVLVARYCRAWPCLAPETGPDRSPERPP
jgi:serine phosphatase RsbU (regulator of sigma subunit)